MRITILCTSPDHPINPFLERWIAQHARAHSITLVRRVRELEGGDLLFLISCGEIVPSEARDKFRKALVIHASPLPEGRGWNPHIWQILAGREHIPVTLLEAADRIDSGDIWHQLVCDIPRDALWDEINARIFDVEVELMNFAVENFATCVPRKQDNSVPATYYAKRSPDDSRIDPARSIVSQFDLIRTCDPNRFPAFFQYLGHTYKLRIEKVHDD